MPKYSNTISKGLPTFFVTGVHILGTEFNIPDPDPLVFQVKGVGSDVTSGTIFDKFVVLVGILCIVCRHSVSHLAATELLL